MFSYDAVVKDSSHRHVIFITVVKMKALFSKFLLYSLFFISGMWYYHSLCFIWSVFCFPVTVTSSWHYLNAVIPNSRLRPKSGFSVFSVWILRDFSKVTKDRHNICLPILVLKRVRIVRPEGRKVIFWKILGRRKKYWKSLN